MMNIRTLIRWTGLALVPVFGACKDAPTTPAAQTTGARASFATVADSGIGGGGGPGNQSHFVANGDFGFATWFSSDTIGGVSQGVTVGQPVRKRGGDRDLRRNERQHRHESERGHRHLALGART